MLSLHRWGHGVKFGVAKFHFQTFEVMVHDVLQSGPFNWDWNTQRLVIEAFYYGYMTTQVLGGVIALKIGGKLVFLFGVALAAALTLLLPVLTTVGGFAAIFTLRFLTGMAWVCISERYK